MVNVATLRSVVSEVWVNKVCPQERVLSQKRKEVLSDVEAMYSPVWNRKKYAIIIMLKVPWVSGSGEASAILYM